MGWTHDYRDAAHDGSASMALTAPERAPARGQAPGGRDPRLGIPRILRRRARWVSARLRHSHIRV
ncbi:hypothetical protein [Streptomyces sp. URMC 123]|uniref:hypothetical protein n=1 Tax=Streptomyces sp. URMC 123 TaxID=3423403 RepID=UPI003F1B0DBC